MEGGERAINLLGQDGAGELMGERQGGEGKEHIGP